MQTVESQGCTLHVRVDGPDDGPVVMLANSLGTDLRVWDPMIKHLPDDLRLIRYDKRGHGLSDAPHLPYAMAQLIADAAAVADAVRAEEVTFVGLSIGGLIGQGLAHARPDLVARLVLMDTAAKIGSAEMWQERIAALRQTGLSDMTDAILDRWFAPALRNDPVALAPWRNMLAQTPLAGYIGCCEAIAVTDFTSQAPALSLPVMAIVGAEDLGTTPELVAATAKLYNAPCHVIPDAGHLPCVEKPAETAAFILDFMKEHTNG